MPDLPRADSPACRNRASAVRRGPDRPATSTPRGIRRSRRREIDMQGDAFFVAFGTASDAVVAAVAGQRALVEHEWPAGRPLLVRMGIHTGEAAVATDRYLGLAVHRAARICAAGHGGQVLLSNTTRELVEDELTPDVSLRGPRGAPTQGSRSPRAPRPARHRRPARRVSAPTHRSHTLCGARRRAGGGG